MSVQVRTWPVAGWIFAILWMFVRGTTLAPMALLGQLLLGLAVGLPIAYLFRRLYPRWIGLGRAGVVPAAGRYLLDFLREVVRSNVDVAYRVLAPSLPMEPEVILIPLRVESAPAITLLANSITVTPGTITLDYAEEANALYVHVVDGRDPDGIVDPIRRWEDYALEMFDEEASSSEPAPEIVVSGGDRWGERSRGDQVGRESPGDPGHDGGDGRDGE
ncbi:Na+/H+ antiporter subunit E [Saliphagus sp. LR7]|uniref:Na+/H+ antiporter subunit E n=1 Tax=Saliphagus sp. LR7 TaxID=2282654 RepID=UPI00210479DD|nr:Na+/H+ antiporter subunit E [Saliphagus sp. LR7]